MIGPPGLELASPSQLLSNERRKLAAEMFQGAFMLLGLLTGQVKDCHHIDITTLAVLDLEVAAYEQLDLFRLVFVDVIGIPAVRCCSAIR